CNLIRRYIIQNAQFEVRLFDEDNHFEFIYGAVSDHGHGATVGVQRGPGTTSTQYECNNSNSGGVSQGLRLVWAQEACSMIPAMVVGHVNWQGRPAQPNSLQQLPVSLTLRSGTTEVNYPG